MSSGMVLPWEYYSTQVTQKTKDTYNETISQYRERHSDKE